MYRFMVTMCFCHDHQRCVMYLLSYVSVVVDFLQTIIWKSLFGNLYLPSFVDLVKKRVMCIVLWSPCAFVTITSDASCMY